MTKQQSWTYTKNLKKLTKFFEQHPFDEFTLGEIQSLVLPELSQDAIRLMLERLEEDEIMNTPNTREDRLGEFHTTYKKRLKYNVFNM